MEYLFLFLALAGLTIKGYCGKKLGIYVRNTGDSFFFNLVRLVLCVLIGLAMVFIEGSQGFMNIEAGMLAVCLLSGIANAAFLVGWLLAVQKNSMVTVDVSLTAGSIIPAALCLFIFGEAISWQKMIGFALIICAALILAKYNKNTLGNRSPIGFLLLVIAMLGDSLSSFAQQLYRQYYTADGVFAQGAVYPKSVFHFYTYIFAAAALLLMFAVYFAARLVKTNRGERAAFVGDTFKSLVRPLPIIFIMAICLFAANYFQTVATGDYGMPSQILYPALKGGCLVTVTFTAILFFGERPTKRSIFGTIVALIGVIAINIW